MNLTRLYLRDFRSFREADLDLSALRAATVVGRNGAGKSTLIIDAPLWALYGQVRGTGADSVVRIGAADCLVTVEFESAGETYRVTRKRSTRGAGKSELEFYRLAGAVWAPLSGKSIAETQAAIDAAVGVSLETLAAASVVQQGDAARFSSATPERRREVLRAILGLDAYKARSQAARERSRTAQARADALARDAEQLTEVERQLDALATRLVETQASEAAAAERQTQADADDHAARVAVAHAQAAVDAEAARLAERATWERRLQSARTMHRAAIERRRAAESEWRGLDEAKRAAERVPGAEVDAAEASRDLDRCNEAVRVAQAAMRAAVDDPGVRELERWLAEAQAEVDGIDARAWMDASNAETRAETTEMSIAVEVQRAEKAAARLRDAPCAESATWTPGGQYRGLDLRGTCPFIADARAAAESLPALREASSEAKRAAAEARAAADVARAEMKRRQDAERRVSTLRSKLDERRRVVGTERSRALSVALDTAEAGGQRHMAALQDLAALRQTAATVEAKQAAGHRMALATVDIEDAEGAIAEAQANLDACRPNPSLEWALEAAQAGAQKAAEAVQVARKAHRDAMAAVERLRAAVVAMENERDRLRDRAEEAARHAAEARAWARTVEALDLAAVLLIERAIPVLEAEANAVLARTSSRGMRVRLDTQRALKSRDGVRETLDIVIRDDVGERPYEDFSGGEQFRIDMALRLGLARLLADREGASIQTLVIDEGGFGALDPEGVAALKETLQALRALYRLVLVVSHIPEVADCFEHRIEVVQGIEGSEIAGAGARAKEMAA